MVEVSNRLAAWEVNEVPWSQTAAAPAVRGPMRRWLPLAATLVLAAGVSLVWLARQESTNLPMAGVESPQSARMSPDEPTPYNSNLRPPLPESPASEAKSNRVVAPLPGPLLARTARLTIVTDRFDAGRTALDALIRRLEGFTGRILVTGTVEQGRALPATLQIPRARLDEAITGLKALGRVTSEGLDGEDVTQESVDLDARLANARNSEKRLTAILANRTGALDDVLAVEREIARVRGEIESMEAQRKALDRRVTYATVDLQLKEEKRAAVNLGPEPLSARFVDEFVRGWDGVLGAGVELALVLARLTPLIVVVVVLSAPVVFFRRRRT